MFRNDDEAGTALMGLLMASGLFAVTVATVIQVSYEPAQDVPQVNQASDGSKAANLADLILLNTGTGWYSGTACQSGTKTLDSTKFQPDAVQRFGLAQERCAVQGDARSSQANLSYEKILNLYSAKLEASSTNGMVDYAEARTSLSLDEEDLDFHLRSYPVLPSVQRILQTGHKDPFLRPLYVGDYAETGGGGGGGAKVVQHSKGVVDGADDVTLYVRITNNGTANTVFGVFFKIVLKSGNIDFTLHTPQLAPNADFNVTVKVRKTSDWVWDDPAKKYAEYKISDKDGDFYTGQVSMAHLTMTHANARFLHFTEADKLWWTKSGEDVEVKVHYATYDGWGRTQADTDRTFRFLNPSDVAIGTYVVPDNKQTGDHKFDLATVGAHKASLRSDDLGTVWNEDRLNVLAADPGPFTPGPAPSTYTPAGFVATEAAYIDLLVDHFDAHVFSNTYSHPTMTYAAGGNVLPDLKAVMDNDLKAALTDTSGNPTLTKHNILFVGTDVDHNAMTSQAAKGTIRDWVLAGGTLVVFGSEDQSVTWLEPLFKVKLESAGGGVSVVDEDHPILTTPNDLDPSGYDPHGTAWHFNNEDDKKSFTHVVTAGGDDVLAVSDPGKYGKGRIILTSWQPHDLTYGSPPSSCQPATLSVTCPGLLVVDNFLTLSYRGLYLDYGPEIPAEAAQGVQSRIAVVWHPELRRHVELYVSVFVFD